MTLIYGHLHIDTELKICIYLFCENNGCHLHNLPKCVIRMAGARKRMGSVLPAYLDVEEEEKEEEEKEEEEKDSDNSTMFLWGFIN